MIDINLIIKPPPAVRWWIVVRTVALVAGLAVAGVTTLTGLLDLRRLDAEIAEQQALAATYQKVSGRLPALQAQLRSAEQAGAELARIARNQRLSQAAVLELIRPATADVWLTDVLFQDADVLISGRSHSFAGAIAYLDGLRRQAQFRAVVEIELSTDSGGETAFTYLVHLGEEGVGP